MFRIFLTIASLASVFQSAVSAQDPPAKRTLRTRSEVDALINKLGRQPPDWFDETPLNYPKTLDLSWPENPEGNWNNQKNVGQYIWDVINPNANKWREGVKLAHHLLTLHKDDVQKRNRDMETLGRMYHHLHQDYARAAFWWRQAGVDKGGPPGAGVYLAECYWQLGNKQMAVDLLNKLPAYSVSIKLWADMGDTKKAIALAEALAKGSPASADMAWLYAGDAYRLVGSYPKAIESYQKVVDLDPNTSNKGRVERNQKRAAECIEAIKLFALSDVKNVKDGKYRSDALGYEAPVHVEVTVKSGKLEDVKVVQHREKQYYSSITDTTARIIAKQGVKGVDATSGATITSEAIINASAKALASGAK